MDAAAHERTRPPVHGRLSGAARVVTPAMVAGVVACLVAAVAGGLLRAGWAVADTGANAWAGQALVFHAALFVCAFFGTVIGVERAIAVRAPFAFIGPVASLAGGLALLAQQLPLARVAFVVAASAFVVVNAVIVARQFAAHTAVLLLAALAWALGNASFGIGYGGPATIAWWFAFLVLTIAGERLEMTRLMPARRGRLASFAAVVAVLLGGATWSCPSPAVGGLIFGAGLVMLAAWLVVFDIARRTVHARGLSRYMAIALLAGYGWLGLGGLAWMATAAGLPWRDAALHAIGLGFVVSMVMAHAPVILPAVLKVRLRHSAWFHVPLALLHGSLVLRLAIDAARPLGAALNVAAMVAFATVVLAHRVPFDRLRANGAS